MRKHFLMFSLISAWATLPLTSLAQSDSTPSWVRKSLWRVSLINFVKPGLSHELGVSRRFSLLSMVNLRTDYSSTSEQNKPTIWYRSVVAQASLSARYYYNLARRLRAGKNSQYNSGNYISLGVHYTSPVVAHWGEQSLDSGNYPTGSVRLVWGIQRHLPPKRFYYDLSAGLQGSTNRARSILPDALTAQLTIGYCLTK